jgi:hypothetical protein
MAYTLGITVADFATIYLGGNPPFSPEHDKLVDVTLLGGCILSRTTGHTPVSVTFWSTS